MEQNRAAGDPPGSKRRTWQVVVAAAAIVLAVFVYWEISGYLLGRELVMANPDEVTRVPRLVSYAESLGATAYAENCASCHGADMKGSEAKGVPNLGDGIWLYDYGRVSDIERTVLYGIRSGNSKAHNVTDMPPLGRQKAITPDEIRDVIAFVKSLKTHEGDPKTLERGERIFQDKGVCYDCHSREGTGISDYGAPSLIDDDWIYGGDDKTIYKSIYDGRHGLCPGWIGKLSFPTIRALAVYVHAHSKESPDTPKADVASGSPPPRGGAG
jgi:cytochrome c oxidase cbb3-type subunit 3